MNLTSVKNSSPNTVAIGASKLRCIASRHKQGRTRPIAIGQPQAHAIWAFAFGLVAGRCDRANVRTTTVEYLTRIKRTLLSLLGPHMHVHGSLGQTLHERNRIRAAILFGAINRVRTPIGPIL